MKLLKIIGKILIFPFALIRRLVSRRKMRKFLSNISLSQIDSINGYDFEQLLAIIFDNLGYKVSTTPTSGDNGVDLIAQKHRLKIVIQCKLYFNHSVGNKAIQEIYAGKNYYQADIGIVITNSKYTLPAIDLANNLNIGLIDRKGLAKLIDKDRKKSRDYLDSLIYDITSKT